MVDLDINIIDPPKRKRTRLSRHERLGTISHATLHFPTKEEAFAYCATKRGEGQNWSMFKCSGNWFATNREKDFAIEEKIDYDDWWEPLGIRLRTEMNESWRLIVSAMGGFNDHILGELMNAPQYAGQLIEEHVTGKKRSEFRSKDLITMLEDRMNIGTQTARRYLHMYTRSPGCVIQTIKQGTWIVAPAESTKDLKVKVVRL